MSHIVRVQTQVRDAAAVSAACRRRELPEPVAGQHKVFQSEVEGLAVRLRGWNFPAHNAILHRTRLTILV